MKNLLVFIFVVCISLVGCVNAQHIESDTYCERCVRLEKAILNILYIVEEDNQDYVLDVLSETDEWCVLEDMIGPINPPIIKDSTYRRMRNVFPDLPAQQAKPIK